MNFSVALTATMGVIWRFVLRIDLSGKKALVTGSTGGIGYAIAEGLLRAGADVIINGRSSQSVERAVQRAADHAGTSSVRGVVADVSTAEGVSTLLSECSDIDILINNTGIYGVQDFFQTPDDVWDEYWETNVMSGMRLSRALVPGMVQRGWGRVVFISSESARNIPADMIHYGVSKTAQVSLARGLAKRLAGTGVTVNSVLPGPTLSDGLASMLKEEVAKTGQTLETVAANFVMAHRPSSIIQRAASVDEVANMVVYLASTLSGATTGAALRVDGGVVDDIL